MSLNLTRREVEGRGFPRVSGDEPHEHERMSKVIEFSPRERG